MGVVQLAVVDPNSSMSRGSTTFKEIVSCEMDASLAVLVGEITWAQERAINGFRTVSDGLVTRIRTQGLGSQGGEEDLKTCLNCVIISGK